ncbi:MAG: hypothetical protein DWC09_03820 [Candidatus Poseidoniales archaeon]|nr:MAG: hypothetical protein DWC09_03820 [Candidatus Poseidoniales archaeon]
MDPIAPRLATGTLVLGLITSVGASISYVLKLGFTNGFGAEEIVMICIAGVLFIVSFFASRERQQMEMISAPTLEEQFSAIESMPTQYRSSSTETDSLGFETRSSEPTQAQAVITSVLGQPSEVPITNVSDAFEALSSGMNSVGRQHVEMNPAPHRHTQQDREVFKSSRSTEDTFTRLEVQNIPLPGQNEAKTSPDLPWQSSKSEFQTDGVAHVPLPPMSSVEPVHSEDSVPEPQIEPIVSEIQVPSMPNLDDLFDAPSVTSSPTATSPTNVPSLPDLPNLDDLF